MGSSLKKLFISFKILWGSPFHVLAIEITRSLKISPEMEF
jgi:hypothetical protein